MRNNILGKLARRLSSPKVLVDYLLCKIGPVIPDSLFLRLRFKLKNGYRLDLKNPRTYNEKLQWLKLYDRNPEYTKMVDKYEAKRHVAGIIGEEHIIPTLGVWDRVEDIDFDALPNQFVLKCTHDSGGIVVCRDKATLNIQEAVGKLRKGLKTDFFNINREWPYKNVKRRIIAEEYKEDESGELADYKFFCFDGEPKILFVATDRLSAEETKFDFYDLEWNHLPVLCGHPNRECPSPKPSNLAEMIDVARKLSSGIPHVRVDLYNCNGRVYFGELTFFHWSGFKPFTPFEWNYTLGSWLNLPGKGEIR